MGAEHKVEIASSPPTAWERGRSLRLSGHSADALSVLQKALTSESNDYRLHDEVGMALLELNRQEEAIGSFLTALRLKPDFDEACNKIGTAFASRGLFEPAAVWFLRARQKNPSGTDYLYPYGCVLVSLNSFQKAAEVFEQWVNAEPNNPIARHLAGAVLGSRGITKASAEYIRALYNRWAPRFDETLAKLKYCGPELLRRVLLQVADPPAAGWEIMDAGCGTGLVGVELRPLARRMVGVDLSAGMLHAARQRNVYDELVEADIVDFLRNHSLDFDVVSASDVLSYLGDLSEFFSCAARAIRLGGLVAVAVEALDGEDNYRLNPTGRFSHSRRYLQDVMEIAGFTVAHLSEDIMRHEMGKPVRTWIAAGAISGA